MSKSKRIIRQIMPVTSPVFAVFRPEQIPSKKTEVKVELLNCHILALVEEGDETEVIPMILTDCGYDDPRGDTNFLGYASSEEQAVEWFLDAATDIRPVPVHK